MNKVRTACWVTGSAAAVMLAACHSAPTRLYSLEPTVPGTHIENYPSPALRVDTLNVPASWDRIEILGRSAAGMQKISEFDHWSAPLSQLARQVLSDDLDQRLPPGAVIFPRLPKADGALGVSVDILEFNLAASKASMRASWLIVPATGSQGAKRSAGSLQAPMNSAAPAEIVRAWSALIGQLADRIAADAASFATP